MELTLPLGPSANRMYQTCRGRTVPSPAYLRFKRAVQAAAQGVCEPLEGPIRVQVAYHPRARKKSSPAPLRRLDTDGPIKPVLDALQGIAYANDYQVVEITCRLAEPIPGGALIVQWQPA